MKTNLIRSLLAILILAGLLLSACGAAAPAIEATIPAPQIITVTAPTTPTSTATPLPPSPVPTRVPMDAFMKGMSYVQWEQGGFSSQASDQLLQKSIPNMGATWIALIATCNQKTYQSTDIFCDLGPNDSEVIHAIQTAHSAGLRVMLKPHLDLTEDPDHWRGDIGLTFDQSQWQTWFENYTSYITHFARIAQEQGVEAFVVGTEMVTPSSHDKEWRKIILAVRDVYSGPLTYAGFQNEFTLTWWDALDWIGVDAYYRVGTTASPTVDQLVKGWKPFVAKLEALSTRWGKPILFTEVGYSSLEGVGMTGGGQLWTNPLDMQEQADCYAAVFQALSKKPWWRGAFWWAMDTNAIQGGVYDTGFSPMGKPAEDVLRQYYGASAPATATPTPINAAMTVKRFILVYDDSFASGWDNASWGADVKPQYFINPYNGQASISVIFHDNRWDTLSLRHKPLDMSGYQFLEFYILSDKDSYAALRVELVTPEGLSYFWKTFVFNPRYIEGGKRLAGKWQRVLIPLSDLGPENPQIAGVNITQDGQAGMTVQIDQIRFLKTQ